jgi:hypothetical protein
LKRELIDRRTLLSSPRQEIAAVDQRFQATTDVPNLGFVFARKAHTPVGNGLPDILSDIQDVCNAALRSLVNNLSIASGPQVVVNTERLAPDEDGEDMYPWKRWRVTSDPMSNNTQVPISFFQPVSNANELLAVYQKFSDIADELSAIPKYLSGNATGGAGRTASGLAMLMGNASKILQTVAFVVGVRDRREDGRGVELLDELAGPDLRNETGRLESVTGATGRIDRRGPPCRSAWVQGSEDSGARQGGYPVE